ncbi:ATP-binding protein [Candidatus Woesearchaeota archaeon]|nr:MAG: ATP-binding protein [Candidatus Woesearchaeota archaeon]
MEFLEKINPHWFDEEDADIAKWKNKKIHIIPEWLNQISLKPFSLNFIMGPRRVGKTTGLKLLIKDLISKKIKPKEIVYINVDLIPELSFFQEVLNYVIENKYKFILIDEVTSLANWWRPLKGFIDGGQFKDSVLAVSGSLTLKVRKQAELFPGRMGFGRKIEVLPLSFPEFFELFKVKLNESEIRKKFQKYLLTGGFLGALDNTHAFLQEIVDAIESEILKIGLSPKLAFEIFSSLLTKIPSAISYQAIASDIGIDYKTVRTYLEIFENMYLLKIVYWKGSGKIKFRKEKKIFFRDPLLLRAAAFWTSTEFLESALYEHIVQEHLYRKFGEIYYYKNKYEIDCIANNLKIEVKAKKPHRKYPENVIVLDEKNIPMFLMKLKKNK